jgi:hypothetical protein
MLEAALNSSSQVVFQAAPSLESPVAKNAKATAPTELPSQLDQGVSQPAARPDEAPKKETYAQRRKKDCEYLATECYKRAEREYKWYMSFFHRDQLDPRDYRSEESRAMRERKESVGQCQAKREECLSEIADDD